MQQESNTTTRSDSARESRSPYCLSKIFLFLLLAGFYTQSIGVPPASTDAEELVTIYNTYGYKQDGEWVIPVRIWVHEKPDLVRLGLAVAARKYLAEKAGISGPNDSEKLLFRQRTEGFIADSESRERVVIEFDQDVEHHKFEITNGDDDTGTDRNGGLEGTIRLSEETADRLLRAQQSNQGWLRLHTVSEDHYGIGFVRLIEPTGLSIISDIDDTVKITGIPEGEEVVLRNTFFRDFTATPCMAEMYAGFGENTAFHYVSGGPWQMYGPLVEFLFSESAGFPHGSIHMKNVRTNPFEKESYQDIWTLVANGSQQATFDQKISQITTLLNRFPGRDFVLIGDSGEKDPEVFRKIRQEFPSQIREIIIRVVTDDSANDPYRLDGMTKIPADTGESLSCGEIYKAALP